MFSEFKKIVLEELTTLNLKVNSIIDTCTNIVQVLRSLKEPPNLDVVQNNEDYSIILQMLPLKNEIDVQKIEDLLLNKNNQQILMSIFISYIYVKTCSGYLYIVYTKELNSNLDLVILNRNIILESLQVFLNLMNSESSIVLLVVIVMWNHFISDTRTRQNWWSIY